MTAPHLSDLALEQHLMTPDSSGATTHLGACAECQQKLEQMQREGDEFRAFVYPATVGKVMAAAPSKKRWLPVFVPVAFAAAAGLLMVFVPPRPPDGYVGAKGGGLGLSVFVADGASSARALEDGEVIPAASALRFKVRPAKPCQLWVVSLDATGQVSRIFPPSGVAGGELREAAALPGGAVLDGRSGPERLFAVCSSGPLDFDTLARAVRAASGAASEDAVRRTHELRDLPAGTDQATLLLEKKP